MNLSKLQNGSDIRGVAMEGVAGEEINLTPAIAGSIAASFAKWLENTEKKNVADLKIAIGMDSRITGESLKDACSSEIEKLGATVIDCGLASTPSMYMSTKFAETMSDGAIMLTASHLPFNRNGMKFFSKEGGLEKADIKSIISIAETLLDAGGQSPTKIPMTPESRKKADLIGIYSRHMAEAVRSGVRGAHTDIQRPLSGLKIIVDAGNGSGGFFTKILEDLGADTNGSIFLEPDGTFPNHAPNPEDPHAMEFIRNATIAQKADLGIIFDTDVDRAAIVDSNGRVINRNALIALLSSVVLRDHPGATIVTDSVTSNGLSDFISSLGGVHHRYKRGYRNVINEAKRISGLGQLAPLAIETSGHGAFKDNFFLDDGAHIVVKILIEMAKLRESSKTISSLIENLREPLEEREIRLRINCDEFVRYGEGVIEEMKLFARDHDVFKVSPDNHEGVRINWSNERGDGWALLRMSLHDPVMPLNIESDYEGGIAEIIPEIKAFLEKFVEIDTSPMQ